MNPTSWQRFERMKSGSVLVMVCVFIIALFAFAALSIDVSNVLHQQRDLQSGADAAALSAVVLLTNSPLSTANVIAEAKNIAAANGVTDAEITNGVLLGQWVPSGNSGSFTAGATPYNAVSVSAKRNVSMNFAQLIGMTRMSPAVNSVAIMSIAGSATGEGGGGLVPFAVTLAQATNAFGVTYSFDKHSIGSGNFGKLDFSQFPGDQGFGADMTSGCNCTVTNGGFYPDISGNADIYNEFYARWQSNPYVVFAVFSSSGPGNSGGGDQIIGFVYAIITDVSGTPGNWTVSAKNIPGFIDGGGGGTAPGIATNYVRQLVQ